MQENTMPYRSVEIQMGAEEYLLAPGNQLDITFIIANWTGQEDDYAIEIRGIPESWVVLDRPVVHLGPGERRPVDLTLQLPEDPRVPPDFYPITVRVVSRSHPEWWGETSFDLRVADGRGAGVSGPAVAPGPVEIRLEATQLAVSPGESLSLPLTLTHLGAVENTFLLSIEGFPPGWVSSPTTMVHLLPGQQAYLGVNIHPPLSPTSRAGRYPYRVRVTHPADARQVAAVDGMLMVGAISQFASDLTPRRVDAGQAGRLRIHNLGNIQDTFTIRLQSPGDDLEFVPVRSGPLRVYPGQSATLDFAISPRSPNWMGGAETFPFSLIVQSSDGEMQVHQGEVVSRSLIPIWVLPALLAFCFTAVFGVGYLWNWNQKRLAESTETAVERLALLDRQTATAEAAAQTLRAVVPGGESPTPPASTTPPPSAATSFPSLTQALSPPPSQTALPPTFTSLPPSSTPAIPARPSSTPMPARPTRTALPAIVPAPPRLTDTAPRPSDTAPPPTSTSTRTSAPTATSTTTPRPAASNATMTAEPVIAGTITPIHTETRIPLPVTGEQRIVYSADPGGTPQLYLYDSRQATGEPKRLTQDSAADSQPAWSPDGKWIAFTSSRDGSQDIFVMNADGSDPVNLTHSPADESQPAWSPDGKQVAFTTTQDNNNEIYVMNADGTNPINLTHNPANDSMPAWYPQGPAPEDSQILFTTDRDGNNEIYRMQADGSNPTNLTQDPAEDTQPAVSPHGGMVAFISDRDGNPDVFVMDLDGSQVANLTRDPASESHPTWSPDGRWLAFVSDANGNQDIFIMNAQGEQRTPLIAGPADETDPSWH